jgi:hypothetical protein
MKEESMTISDDELFAFVEQIIEPGFDLKAVPELIGHLDAEDRHSVVCIVARVAIRQRDKYWGVMELMREIIHSIEDAPARVLPDVFEMVFKACNGDLTRAIEGMKTGRLMVRPVTVDDEETLQ